MQISQSIRTQLTAIIVALALCFTLNPKRSEAAICTGGTVAAIGGILIVTGILGVFVPGLHGAVEEDSGASYEQMEKEDEVAVPVFFSGIVMLFTGIILDQEGSPNYVTLSSAQGESLGLTGDELAAYNSQTDEINGISQNVIAAIRESGKSGRDALEYSGQLWGQYRDALDPATFSALTKVARQSLK